MSPGQIDQIVREALATACERPAESLDEDASILDLGLDSLRLVSVLGHVSSACDVDLGGEDVIELFNAPSVRDLISLVADIAQRRLPSG